MKNKLIPLVFLLLVFLKASTQSAISGPDCVVPGIEYQYSVSSGGSGSMQVCVTGGSLLGATNNCISGSLSTVRIIWNDLQTGNITLTSGGNASKTVAITKELQPGIISDSLIQLIQAGAIPATIHCSPASGGGCSPSYSYQWEKSPDNVDWENITGATGQNLSFSTTLTEATFFRRKVTNTISNSTGYSDVASAFIIPQGQLASLIRNSNLPETFGFAVDLKKF